MANSLRGVYGSDVLIATCNSFTGSVFQADYTEKMLGCMILELHKQMGVVQTVIISIIAFVLFFMSMALAAPDMKW